MKKYELIPEHVNQKSFYEKAVVTVYGDGSSELKSYDTIVCGITASGEFKRYWCGFSATTAKHIHEYRLQNGLDGICKKEWLNLPVVERDFTETLVKMIDDYNKLA